MQVKTTEYKIQVSFYKILGQISWQRTCKTLRTSNLGFYLVGKPQQWIMLLFPSGFGGCYFF